MPIQKTYIPYVTNFDQDTKQFTNVKYNSNSDNHIIPYSVDSRNRIIWTDIEWKQLNWRFQLKGNNIEYPGIPEDFHHITKYHDPGSGIKTVNLHLSSTYLNNVIQKNNYKSSSSTYDIIRTNIKRPNWEDYPLTIQPSTTGNWSPLPSNVGQGDYRRLTITSNDSNLFGSPLKVTTTINVATDARPWAFFYEDIVDRKIYLDLNVAELNPISGTQIYNDSFFNYNIDDEPPSAWDLSKRVWTYKGTGSYIDAGYFGTSNIVPFTIGDYRTPGYTDVHLYNHVRRHYENIAVYYTEDDTQYLTEVESLGLPGGVNESTSINVPIKTYRIERKIHSKPTLTRTGKVLSWSSDTNVNEGWELQWSNQSNFSTVGDTITLPTLQNSYTIPNHLYYTNTGTTRYWRLRKKTNTKIIQTEEKQWKIDIDEQGELRQGYNRTVASMYFYSDWSSSISTNLRVPNVTSVNGTISLQSIRRAIYSWNHSSESAVTRYEYSLDGSTWEQFSSDKPTSFTTYPYETTGQKWFYIRSVLIGGGYTLYSTTISRSVNLIPLYDPSEEPWSATRGTRTGINTYSAQWNQFGIYGWEDDVGIQYRQYVGTTPITDQTQVMMSISQPNIPISLVNLRYATNTVRARAVLIVDGVINESFSSNSSDTDLWGTVDNFTLTTTELPKIAKPNLSKTAITTIKNIAGTNRTVQLGIQLGASVPTGQPPVGYIFKKVRDYSGGTVTTLIPASGYQSSSAHTEAIPDDDVTIYPVGDYDYSVQAVSGIVYNGVPYTDFDSDWSDIVEDVVQGMDPPVLTFKDPNTDPNKHRQDIVLISKPAEADYVAFTMTTDAAPETPSYNTTGSSLELRTLIGGTTVPGEYDVFGYSMSFDKFHKNGSIDSNHLTYETIKLGTPQNVTWSVDDQKLTWSAVTHANWYKVYERISGNNVLIEETSDLETTVPFDTGVHELWVVATNRRMVDIDSVMVDYNEYSNPRYINSNESVHVSFGTLPTPDPLIRIGNTLHWSTSEGADYYELYLNDEVEPYKIIRTTFETLSNAVDGTFSWKVRAVKPGNPELISGFTNTVTYTIQKILPPVLEFNPNTMETFWNQPANATDYDLKIDGSIETTITEENRPTTINPYIIPRTAEGDYYISVEAKNTGEDPFLYPRSISSNVEVYSIFKLATPTITYNPVNTEINWDAIQDANQYTIHLRENGGSYNDNYATTIDNEWDTTPLPPGTYAIKIHATQTGQGTNTNPLYIESNISNEIQFGTLAKPVISLSDAFIVWDAIDFADYYEIFNYDEKIAEVTNNEFDISSDEAKTYRYTIRARSNQSVQIGGNIDDTDTLSNAVTVTFFQLATPSLSILDGGTLSWQSIPFATGYEIYLNNALHSVVDSSTTTYFIEPGLIPGRNIMYIRAVSNLFNYINSGHSNNVNYLKVVNYQYTAIIDGEEYNCWLPFSVQEVLDGSIATGSIILEPISRATPFEKDTPVSFYVYSDPEQKVPYHEWHLLVDSDTVEEFQIGTKALWKHRIDLIGKEKLLQYDYITFSISQKKSYIDARYTSVVSKNLQGEIAGGAQILPVNFSYATSGPNPRVTSTEHNFVTPTMFSTAYRISDGIKLYDAPVESKWIIKYLAAGEKYYQSHGEYDSKTYEAPITWRWKWRNHTSGTNVKPGFPETVIVPDSNNIWRPSNLGTYDLIMEIIPHNLPNIGGLITDGISTPNLSPFYTGELKGTPNIFGHRSNKSWAEIKDQLVPGRIVFSKIEVSEIIENIKEFIPGRKTVGDAIRKALNLVELTSYSDANKKDSETASTKWMVSKESLQIADQIDCPDLVFENKNLFEILTELGKLFQGIPKLTRADNIIDFKIIDQMDINDAFKDTEELMNVSSPLPQYSNAYISDVKNMLTEDNMLVFPGGDLWTRANTMDSSGIVSAMNAVIKLPFPIKKILDVRVRNVLRNKATEISIINFIKEKTVYDSLTLSNVPGDVNSKAYNIYYKEGSNTIEGLGVIPSQTEVNKTLGLNETNYVIENILGYLTGMTKEQDVQSYEFKVYYEPIIDTKVLIEKPNIAGFRNKSVKSLNQTESLVSDVMFAQGSQRILSRLANKFITKTYRQQHFSLTPRLGQTITFEGVKYYADVINISYYNTYADIKVNYSEKINKLNERMKPDASYRAYNIETSGFVNRDLRQDEYVYITRQNYTDYPYPENAGNKIRRMYGPVRDVYLGLVKGTPLFAPNYLTINNTIKNSTTRATYKPFDKDPEKEKPLPLPNAALSLNKNFLGNSILFSAQAESNYSYGKSISGEQEMDLGAWQEDADNALQWLFKVDPYRRNFQRDVRYVDNDGENESMNLSFIRINSPMRLSKPIQDYKGESINTLPEIRENYEYTDIPAIDRLFQKHVYVQKDMRELLRFQYQLHFQTFDENLHISPHISKQIYKEVLPTYRTQPVINAPKWVLFRGDIKNNPTLHNIKIEELTIPDASQTGYEVGEDDSHAKNYLTIGPDTFSGTIEENWDGYMLMRPDSKMYIMAYYKPIEAGSYEPGELTDKWTLRFSPFKLDYKEY